MGGAAAAHVVVFFGGGGTAHYKSSFKRDLGEQTSAPLEKTLLGDEKEEGFFD